jgi:hypothetical protein
MVKSLKFEQLNICFSVTLIFITLADPQFYFQVGVISL